jgi:hypothetical protein
MAFPLTLSFQKTEPPSGLPRRFAPRNDGVGGKGSSKNKPYFLPVYFGFEARQSLASNRVNPTQNRSTCGGPLLFPQKRAKLSLVFFCKLHSQVFIPSAAREK